MALKMGDFCPQSGALAGKKPDTVDKIGFSAYNNNRGNGQANGA